MLIDTHAHPEQADFDNDRDKIINDSFSNGLDAIIAVGTTIESSRENIELSNKYPRVFPTAGMHPNDAKMEIDNDYRERFEDLVSKNLEKIVAIGECGLDIFTHPNNKNDSGSIKAQIELFEFQLGIAEKYNLPVIIHCRNGWREIFGIIDKYNLPGGVFHCWTGGVNELNEAQKRGFYVAFGGILTFKNAGEILDAAKIAKLDLVVLETDSPFLAPEGLRGSRNEPKNVRIVAEFLAKVREQEIGYIEDITSQNAKKLFRLNI